VVADQQGLLNRRCGPLADLRNDEFSERVGVIKHLQLGESEDDDEPLFGACALHDLICSVVLQRILRDPVTRYEKPVRCATEPQLPVKPRDLSRTDRILPVLTLARMGGANDRNPDSS
jgi:hypothetical protein